MTAGRDPVAVPPRVTVPVEADRLAGEARRLLGEGFRLALVAGHDDGPRLRVVYAFVAGGPDRRIELEVPLDPGRPDVPSLAAGSFPASRFERELRDLFGIEPVGHPAPRPLVRHEPWPAGYHPMRRGAGGRPVTSAPPAPFPFVTVDGPGVYELPVGPVHAGLIEPGHFRFSVVGETILKMKARLWYLHRGLERLFEGRTVRDGVALAERIAGDSAVGHTVAYCLAVEEACGIEVTPEQAAARAVLVELERVHNHVADVGALCNDVGFGLAQAAALVLRERLLRLNAEVTGHRLLRGCLWPGGIALRRLPARAELDEIAARFDDLVALAMGSATVVDRFRGTAVLPADDAAAMGTLGVVARASGSRLDARVAHPFSAATEGFAVATAHAGDVLARFSVRVDEVRVSLGDIATLAARLGPLPAGGEVARRAGSGLGIVEGWRGSIVHRVEVGGDGRLTRCKVVDPSFLNWPALAVALTDTIVPDFPLANKSFNLSYAGNDL